MSRERWITREGNKVYLESENDGWSYMNRGAEPDREEIISADQNGVVTTDGTRYSSSTRALQTEAMKHFADIADGQQNG